jgi:hypothetical protein
MKRSLMVLLAGVLVFVLASPLYAAPDIKVNGQIRTRLRYWSNFNLDADRLDGSAKSGSSGTQGMGDRRYWDIRTRLGVDAKLSDGVRAVIQLEKYWDWGNVERNGGFNPGLATPGSTPQEPYFRQAYMDFAIPGLQEQGTRIQAGRSFFRVGHGNLWGNSLTGEDGITVYGPLGPGKFKLRYAILDNQSPLATGRQRYGDNEQHMWGVDYNFDVAEKQNIELYFMGYNDKAITAFTGTAGSATNIVLSKVGLGPVEHGQEYFFGAAYTGVAGPVALKAEGAYAFGPIRKNVAFNSSGPCTVGGANPAGAGSGCTMEDNISRSAFFVYGEATYKVIPAWNVGLAFSFATGDDDPLDDTADNFVLPAAEFTQNPARSWVDSEFFWGNRSARGVGNNATNRFLPLSGKATQDIDAKYSIGDFGTPYSAGLFSMQFKTKYSFNKQVTGFANVIPSWAPNHPDGVSKYMGTSIDAKLAYKPYKNIAMNMYGGYFITGGFFDQSGPCAAGAFGGSTICNGSSNTTNSFIFRVESIVTF